MERLGALCVLWGAGFCSKECYVEALDEMFAADPESDFLLELEELSGDFKATFARFAPIINERSADEFGRVILTELELYYTENVSDKAALERFARMVFKLWELLLYLLPFDIAHRDPFVILSYADEPLSWGDEKQSRELYQAAFDYYR